MDKKTNIAPDEKSPSKNRLYTNYNVGILSMLVGVGSPFILPILGSFLAPLIFLGGMIAILIAKKPIWLRLVTVIVLVAPIIIWWDIYEFYVFEYTQSSIQPAE